MKNLDKIVSSINSLRQDIKAEAIIADIVENGVGSDDIVAVLKGGFKRRFKRDLTNAEIKELGNGQKVLAISLTRDGLYDTLPEGIFHQQPIEANDQGREMAHESKKQKKEEKEARQFFSPIENELFWQRVCVELEERKVLKRFSESLFDDIFPRFWNLDKSLPKKYVSRMVLILHFAHKIVGYPERMARTLEIILEEPVSVSKKWVDSKLDSNGLTEKDNLQPLGFANLGVDFALPSGIRCEEAIQFTIGPLNNTVIDDYLNNGPIARFIDCFYNFFVPIEYTVFRTLLIRKEEMDFVLSDGRALPVLGYNTAI